MYVVLFVTLLLGAFGTTFGSLEENDPCITPNKENATCVPLNTCTVIRDAASTGNPKATEFAKDSQCGFNNGPLVCCGSSGYPENYKFDLSSLFTEKPPKPPASHVIQNSFEIQGLSDKSICGIQSTTFKIKGGEIADLEEFPWMAAIECKSKLDDKTRGIQCGGSIITEKYVLTAAHCIKHIEMVPIKVWLGVSNISGDGLNNCLTVKGNKYCGNPAEKFNIKEQIVHELYNKRQGINDIGLLLLEKKITFNNYIRPICLPSPYLPPTVNGTRMMVAGWGVADDDELSEVKLKVEIPVRPNSFCNEVLQKHSYKTITSVHLCAGGEHRKDTCQGDSGGPLMRRHKDLETNQIYWYVEGIVSYGVGCAVTGRPAVYTRVPRFIKWISNTINRT